MTVMKIQMLKNQEILAKLPQDDYSEKVTCCQIPFTHHVHLLGSSKKKKLSYSALVPFDTTVPVN